MRILIYSDDPLARSGLAAILATKPEITIAAPQATDEDIVQALDVYAPDAIVWDFGPDAVLSLEIGRAHV